MIICALNNYPLKKMIELADKGISPAQHAWGVERLISAGHDVRLAPFHEPNENHILERAARRTRQHLGQLDQEAWAALQHPDLYYSADQRSLRGIAFSRRLLARNAALVSIIHHSVRASGVSHYMLSQHHALISLSAKVTQELRDVHRLSKVLIKELSWGPELSSALYKDPADTGVVVSAGKSNRDLSTLVKALEKTRFEATIYDLGNTLNQAPPGISVIRPGGHGRDPDSETGYLANTVIDQIRRAAIVAIPVTDPLRLTGLTEVNDALAFGKPIIMTRSPYMPVDVETIGCGFVVEHGDVDGWGRALDKLRDADRRKVMGERGRQFAESVWNYQRFTSELLALLESLKT